MGLTTEQKAKAYDEALEKARMYRDNAKAVEDYAAVARCENIFPELRESEDERIRKKLYNTVMGTPNDSTWFDGTSKEAMLAWLEKQKGNQYFAGYAKGYSEGQLNPKQEEIPMPNSTELIEMWDKEEAMLREKDFRGDTWRIAYNAFMDGFARGTCVKFEKPDIEICPHSIKSKSYKEQNPISQEDFDAARDEALWEEQKPNSTEDMPYIADEHFYERAPADSFKYKLAEYMTKGCTKKEGPYGYTYAISAETILKMAEEELLKRGVVQKPAECIEFTNEFENQVSHLLVSVLNGEHEYNEGFVRYAAQSLLGYAKKEQKSTNEQFPPLEGLDAIKAKYYDDGFKNGFDEGVESVKPAEWSEEDKTIIEGACNALEIHGHTKLASMLKSLRPQPSWKPSEEHLSALLAVFNDPDNIGSQTCQLALTDLYEQLKKL